MKTLFALILLGSLTGCGALQVVQDHPVIVSVGTVLVAGSIVASQHHDYRQGGQVAMSQVGNPSCAGSSCK